MNVVAAPARQTILKNARHIVSRLGSEYAELTLVAVRIESVSIDRQIAWENAKRRVGVVGWARSQSGKMRSDSLQPAESELNENGQVIFGEWAIDFETSVHLRPDPLQVGRFVEWTYFERRLLDEEVPQAEEHPALRQTVRVLTESEVEEGREQEVFVYHVFWGAAAEDAPFNLRRLCSRFAGIERVDAVWHRNRSSLS